MCLVPGPCTFGCDNYVSVSSDKYFGGDKESVLEGSNFLFYFDPEKVA